MPNMTATIPDEKRNAQWIAAKPLLDQEQATRVHFEELLESASQPRHASGNTCVRLCYFLDLCRKSTSAVQRKVAFAEETCLDLFNFYIESNEKNQHRSMRQVLELVVSLITLNPDREVSSTVKVRILERALSIITHQSAQPLVKPSFKALECFVGKDAISLAELIEIYGCETFTGNRSNVHKQACGNEELDLWDSLVSAIFEWMSLPDTSPAAGKFLVTMFQKLKAKIVDDPSSDNETYTVLWHQCIRHGLITHPDSLENIKNHLFPPLFKLDKIGSLNFLQDLGRDSQFEGGGIRNSEDAEAILLLSAMEVGKKSGLIDEPDLLLNDVGIKPRNKIMLPERAIGELLSHKAGIVRSAAFSVLISSVSSTRPFSLETLHLIRQNLELLHSDTDAKVRNEVLSNTKHMIGRIKGGLFLMAKEAASKHAKRYQMSHKIAFQEAAMLEAHEEFILWYQNFLVNELVPTASYQRHIIALKAAHIVADSGNPRPAEKMSHEPPDTQSQEHQSESFFTKKMIRLLLDLVMNPFEDVRASATHLLKLAPGSRFTFPDDLESSQCRNIQESLQLYDIKPNEDNNKTWNKIVNDAGEKDQPRRARVPKVLGSFIPRAETASQRTGRADLADGVSRSYELICCLQATEEARLDLLEYLVCGLEMKVTVAETDLAQAVLYNPIHGQFAALRLVWEALIPSLNDNPTLKSPSLTPVLGQMSIDKSRKKSAWIDLQYRMVECCTRIWNSVKDVLCNDSPEGHFPQDVDSVDTFDTKDLLSYSFRAIHESSNLLRVIADKLKLEFFDTSPIVPFEVFQAAGNLTFEQLSHLRHRGAFSTVSSTFARCCQLTEELCLSGHLGSSVLGEWHQSTLLCIHEQSSTTRRSAGIPSLITGILSANSKSSALEDIMAQLKTLASQQAVLTAKDATNLPQVHAMNCLKEVFKSSYLGKRCENHILDCLKIASQSLKSEIWAIQNCGLLLLRSLIDCLFGTSESKSVTEAGWDGRSNRLAYERYPALPEILLNLISEEIKNKHAGITPRMNAVESVFPALDIIRRAGPPKKLQAEIQACIKVHLGSNIWHVRDMAARTICTLLLCDTSTDGLINLLETCDDATNQVHGVLLAVKYLLDRRLELSLLTASEGLMTLKLALDHFWVTRYQQMSEPINEAAFIEVRTFILKIAHITGNEFMVSSLAEGVLEKTNVFFKSKEVSTEESRLAIVIQPTLAKRCSFLLARAVAIRALYTSAYTKQLGGLEELITLIIRYDLDIACDILGQISAIWNVEDIDIDDFMKVVSIYTGAYSSTSYTTIQTIALQNLANILEHASQSGWLEQTQVTRFNNFCSVFLSFRKRGSPDLSNAETRMTGSLLALDYLHHVQQKSSNDIAGRINSWGEMLMEAGQCENDFDTRFAAISALRAFYYAYRLGMLPLGQSSFLVPSLLALYNALNDDDEEIRDVGSSVVARILGSHQAPLAASTQLLRFLHQNFGAADAFRTAVMHRIANSNNSSSNSRVNSTLEPADRQLAATMQDDDSLFAEEEQNLYIDDVREAIAWTALLETAESPLSDDQTSRLWSWAAGGLLALTRHAEAEEDGPLGWASKPRVFAICMRIILAAKALLVRHVQDVGMQRATNSTSMGEAGIRGKSLRDAMRRLLDVGRRNNLHPVLLEQLISV